MTGMGDRCDTCGKLADCCGNCGCEPQCTATHAPTGQTCVLAEGHDGWHQGGEDFDGALLHWHSAPPCRHEESLYGRCTRCGMTWEAQAKARETVPAGSDAEHRQYRRYIDTSSTASSIRPMPDPYKAGSDTADEGFFTSADDDKPCDRLVPSPAPAGIVQEPEGRIMGVDHGPFPTLGSSPAPEEITHACPRRGEMVAPCCGITPFELPRTDRMTSDPALVTCSVSSPEPDDERDALAQVIEYAHRTGPVSVGEPSMARESADLILAAGWKSPTEVAALVASTRAQVAGEVVEMCRQESKKASLRELSDRNAYLRRTVWDRAERFARAAAEGGGQ